MKNLFLSILMVAFFTSCFQKEQPKIEVEYTLLTPKEFRERLKKTPVAYLPLGTLEWHGEHLPLGSDGLQSSAFFCDLAREAGGIVLPMLFIGPDAQKQVNEKTFYGMDFWFDQKSMKDVPEPSQLEGSAYWISDSLFCQILEATLFQLKRAGFKMVVAHGHGPSTTFFTRHSENWEQKYGLKLMICWFRGAGAENGIMCDHAAMNETSLVMHYYPELVKMNQLPADTNIALRGVAGKDPRKYASAEKGEKIVKENLERMKTIIKNELGKLQ